MHLSAEPELFLMAKAEEITEQKGIFISPIVTQ